MYPDQERMFVELKKNERALGMRFVLDGDRLNIIPYDGADSVSKEILDHARNRGVQFVNDVLGVEASPLMFVTSVDSTAHNAQIRATIKLDRLVSADVIGKLNDNNQGLSRG